MLNKNNMEKKTAVVFLTKAPQQGTIDFAKKIALDTKFQVFIVIDDWDEFDEAEGITQIQIPDEMCLRSGYHSTMTKDSVLNKNPISWDKFLLHFCKIDTSFDFIWVFEDDVFVPSVDTIVNLHNKYGGYDLVTPNNFKREGEAMDWHWKHVIDKINPPYYFSMVCAMGISKKVLTAVREFVEAKNTLFFNEIIFNTLAMQNDLNVYAPLELKSIVWLGNWGIDEWLLLPDNVFHPLKQIDEHEAYRNSIKSMRETNYIPKNNLPSFIKDLM
jgi:hypothetical protein